MVTCQSFCDYKSYKINTAPWIYVISFLNGEEIVGAFYKKELKKNKQIRSNLK